MMIRADYIFSYWLIAWFLIYYIRVNFLKKSKTVEHFIKYGNPKFALLCALFENLCVLCYIFVKNANWYIIAKYVISILVLKIIPLYLLQPYRMNLPNDIYVTFTLFLIYFVYLRLFSESVYNIYVNKIGQSILLDKNETPLEYLLYK